MYRVSRDIRQVRRGPHLASLCTRAPSLSPGASVGSRAASLSPPPSQGVQEEEGELDEIRTEHDRGLLVLCDARLHSARYGARLLEAAGAWR